MRFTYLIFTFLAVLALQSCNKKGCTDPTAVNYNESATKDDGSCEPEIIVSFDSIPVYNHSGFIVSDETWTSDFIHILYGKVVVNSGVTLTIAPGTLIKGSEGSGTLGSMLIVEPGGRINAEGTAQSPIIFTSILDNIEIGQFTGTNLNENDKGLWGGVALLGYAPISAADGDINSQIHGVPTGVEYLNYGGTDPSDNSGTFKYVSIRHAGTLIGAGNEINGLTLAGVGSATQIDHIETVACQDDGIQVFGGTVNVTNVVVGFVGDDGLETEENFDGAITNALIICDNNSDKGIDMEGPRGLTYLNGTANLSDISIIHFQGGNVFSQFRGEVKGTLSNVNFSGDIRITASYENDCLTPLPNALDNLIGITPKLFFQNCERGALTLSTSSMNASSSMCSIPPTDQSTAESAFPSIPASGANVSHFDNWTWLSVNGKL